MKNNWRSLAAVSALALIAATNAQAQLNDGNDGSFSTSVFISIVERDGTNAAVRNLVIDTGIAALDLSDNQTPWSTTVEQEAQILNFINSATGTVRFNIGGALTDQSFGTDLYALMASGNTGGPGSADFTALGSGVTNTSLHINNANNGTFSPDGVLTVNGPTDPGFHELLWGNSVGGALPPSNELAFGTVSQIQQWRLDFGAGGIVNAVLGDLTSNAVTGDISFGVIPVPAAVWLFGSALGLLGWVRRRTNA